ncbi:MAG TPA: hypothetical protein VFR68_07850 [Candidatus Dormibacteraeota bacterium]|nr:hypothetical protein [Candidatus Dormibacteraeota bacterium]
MNQKSDATNQPQELPEKVDADAIFFGPSTGLLLPDLIVFSWRHVWEIADRSFKLTTWLIVLATVRVIWRVTGNEVVQALWVYLFLIFAWALMRCGMEVTAAVLHFFSIYPTRRPMIRAALMFFIIFLSSACSVAMMLYGDPFVNAIYEFVEKSQKR